MPDLPEVLVEGISPLEVEERLPYTVERHLDELRRRGQKRPPAVARAAQVHVELTTKGRQHRVRRPGPSLEDLRRTRDVVRGLFRAGVPLPADVVNAVLTYSREVDELIRLLTPAPPPQRPQEGPEFGACMTLSIVDQVPYVGPGGRGTRFVLDAEDGSGSRTIAVDPDACRDE